jgi:hypothetical protein
MNERILELADKAVEDMPSGPWNIPDEFCKKFAELIVKECMNVLDPGEHQLIARFQARKWLAEHFGVEE